MFLHVMRTVLYVTLSILVAALTAAQATDDSNIFNFLYDSPLSWGSPSFPHGTKRLADDEGEKPNKRLKPSDQPKERFTQTVPSTTISSPIPIVLNVQGPMVSRSPSSPLFQPLDQFKRSIGPLPMGRSKQQAPHFSLSEKERFTQTVPSTTISSPIPIVLNVQGPMVSHSSSPSLFQPLDQIKRSIDPLPMVRSKWPAPHSLSEKENEAVQKTKAELKISNLDYEKLTIEERKQVIMSLRSHGVKRPKILQLLNNGRRPGGRHKIYELWEELFKAEEDGDIIKYSFAGIDRDGIADELGYSFDAISLRQRNLLVQEELSKISKVAAAPVSSIGQAKELNALAAGGKHTPAEMSKNTNVHLYRVLLYLEGYLRAMSKPIRYILADEVFTVSQS
jgi:hypothetical protein